MGINYNRWLMFSLLSVYVQAILIPFQDSSITITYRLDSSWQTGYQAALIITNNTTKTLENWTLSFNLPHNITSYWNALQTNLIQNTYTFSGPSWQKNIPAGASAAIGFVAQLNGTYSQPTQFVINGQATAPDPIPNPTPTPTPQPGVPAKPAVSIQQIWTDPSGSYDVSWAIYYGNKGTSWQLFENDQLIHSAPLIGGDIQSTQNGSYRVTNKTYGVYVYKVVITNSAGTTTSDTVAFTVGGASKIMINSTDNDEQQVQITIDQAPIELSLAVFGVIQPSFSVTTNNPTILTPTINGSTLSINPRRTGRASVRIKENSTGETRYLGIRVRTADGQLPGLPPYVALGSVSEDTPRDLTFWKDFNTGLKNKWVDIRYIYINGGPFNGWRTWSNQDGGRAITYIRESKKLGFIPFFVYYNIPDGGESYYTNKQHIEDPAYMKAYFQDLKFFLDIVRTQGNNEMVGIVLEPDFLGYIMQNSNGNNPIPASQVLARTDAVYASGVLNANSDPSFPNSVKGLVQCINYLISKYAPNAIFGWQFNLWASPGITTSIPSNGLMHKTDTLGITQGRTVIVSEAQAIAQYYKDAGVTSYGAHFVSIDKYGLDAGISSPQNPAQSTWFWNADHWNNYLLFARTLGQVNQLPVVLWQMPVGRINATQSISPYTNTSFPVLSNTSQHYEDSTPVFFLGDTFKPGTQTRLDYFKTNQGLDPKVSSFGENVTWQSHMQETKNNGIIAVLFGAGVGDSTQSLGNPPADSYWWISKAQEYFAQPVAL